MKLLTGVICDGFESGSNFWRSKFFGTLVAPVPQAVRGSSRWVPQTPEYGRVNNKLNNHSLWLVLASEYTIC